MSDEKLEPHLLQKTSLNELTKIHWPTCLVGLAIGLLLSFGVLTGDNQGRVNLLFLLVIFVAIPILSLVIASASFAMDKSINLAQLITLFSEKLGNKVKSRTPITIPKFNRDWLFLQSQFAAISYSAGSIFGLIFLLLFSDINFIWRSTILTPENVLPILEVIALPWWFWPDAQPDFAILQATQDSRITTSIENPAVFAYWWPFVFATQIVYSLGLRIIALLIAKQIILRKAKRQSQLMFSSQSSHSSPINEPNFVKAKVSHNLPVNSITINWAGFDNTILDQIEQVAKTDGVISAGPLANENDHLVAESDTRHQLVVVKAWEPPLGELSDYLQTTNGLIMPIDVKNNQLTTPDANHLDEWCRFVAEHKNWGVFLPKQLMAN
ncbi:MAG: DUF2868 domain-containing protein [Gammaproteobacteria bacterium]|nr:DUF2868 domain-containing protein [Gammaproteobacteria bacterium]